MEPRIQYAKTSDGVSIAYCVVGKGYPLLACPMFIESFSLEHLVPERQIFMRRLGAGRTLIRYDMRGTGLSTRAVTDVSPDALAEDIRAVADTLNLKRFALFALTLSGPRAIQYAAAHPKRVSHLILYGTSASAIISDAQLRSWAELARTSWDVAAQTFSDLSLRQHFAEPATRIAEQYRKSASGGFVADLILSAGEVDVRASLGSISAKTLILHRLDDALYPSHQAHEMAAAIPRSRFASLQGSAHEFALGDTDAIHAAIDDILPHRTVATMERSIVNHVRPLPSGTAVMLFADIADSTALTERLGDAAFRQKAGELDGTLRGIIHENGGTCIDAKTLGDGVLAVFTSARQAIEAALACGKAGDDAGLPLHLGIHAGDVIREENNVYGGAVNVASRISGLSAAGEVLVSETVRSLARTSAGVRFEDRGEQVLKGVGEAVRVWAVRAEEQGTRNRELG